MKNKTVGTKLKVWVKYKDQMIIFPKSCVLSFVNSVFGPTSRGGEKGNNLGGSEKEFLYITEKLKSEICLWL